MRTPFCVGAGNPDRGERRGLLERDLAGLAQLEQGEERDGLLDPRQARRPRRRSRSGAGGRARRGSARGTARQAGSAAPCARARPAAAGSASTRSAAASCSGSCGASPAPAAARAAPGRRGSSGRARRPSRSASQRGRLLHAPVLGEAPRQLLGRLLRLELGELGLLVREERARLQLEQRGDQDEELPARLEIELVALGQPLDEGDDDRGHVDLGRLELLLQDERQEQVERALEGVEVQLEVAKPAGHAAHASGAVGRGRAGRPSRGGGSGLALPGRGAGDGRVRRGGTATRRRRRRRATKTTSETHAFRRMPGELVRRVDAQLLEEEAEAGVERRRRARRAPAA